MPNKFFTSFIALFLVDQITKVIFTSRDFFLWNMHFGLVKNHGLSFGLNFGSAINLIIIVVALVLFTIYLPKDSNKLNFGIVLVTSGALSNLADRIVLGYVRDFWDMGLGFTFNLADLFIVIGLIKLLFSNSTTNNQEQLVK